MKTTDLVKDWAEKFGEPVNKRIGVTTEKELELAISLVKEEFKEVIDALKGTDEHEIKKEITDLYWVVVRLAQVAGINLEDTVKAVYDSNMTKLCNTQAEAAENQAEYWQGTHQYGKGKSITTKLKQVAKKWVIRRASDGKIMKSNRFVKTKFK